MKRLVTWILILVLLLAGFVAVRIVLAEVSPFKGYEGPEQFVDIPQRSGPASIGRRLSDAGVIRDTLRVPLRDRAKRARPASPGW